MWRRRSRGALEDKRGGLVWPKVVVQSDVADCGNGREAQ